jgi:transposase-like protein
MSDKPITRPEFIVKMYYNGYSIRHMGRRFHIPHSTIRRTLKAEHVVMRKANR